MTHAEEYAQKRAEIIASIEQHAPERLQQTLIEFIIPAISLYVEHSRDEDIAVGASKFGGAPDVATDFEWPMWNGTPLLFLARINMEEVSPFDLDKALPEAGILSFFYGVEEASCEPIYQIFWFDGELNRVKSAPCSPYVKTCSISFALRVEEGDYFYQLSWEDFEEWLAANRARPDYQQVQRVDNPPPLMKMLGYPDGVYGPVEVRSRDNKGEPIHPKPKREDYRLLLQVDSDRDLGVNWYDVGVLYFLIRKDDLKARRFDRVQFDMGCG